MRGEGEEEIVKECSNVIAFYKTVLHKPFLDIIRTQSHLTKVLESFFNKTPSVGSTTVLGTSSTRRSTIRQCFVLMMSIL
jgi:hypothetical protein